MPQDAENYKVKMTPNRQLELWGKKKGLIRNASVIKAAQEGDEKKFIFQVRNPLFMWSYAFLNYWLDYAHKNGCQLILVHLISLSRSSVDRCKISSYPEFDLSEVKD